MTLICVPLVARTVEEMEADAAAAAAAGGDLIEIRLDFIQGFRPREHLQRLLRGCPLPALVTYRFAPPPHPAPHSVYLELLRGCSYEDHIWWRPRARLTWIYSIWRAIHALRFGSLRSCRPGFGTRPGMLLVKWNHGIGTSDPGKWIFECLTGKEANMKVMIPQDLKHCV